MQKVSLEFIGSRILCVKGKDIPYKFELIYYASDNLEKRYSKSNN